MSSERTLFAAFSQGGYNSKSYLKKKPKMLAIQLPPDAESRLESIARTKGCTLDEYIREIVLTALEDAEDIADAEEALADLRAGRLKVIPDEELP